MKTEQITIPLYLLVLLFTVCFSACTSLEGLIKQGKLQEAEEYCKNQDEGDKLECYSKLAESYLQNKNYDKAVEYYTKTNNSEIIKDGYIKIAKSYMNGEFKDTTLIIDVSKAQYYLKKVYDDEKEIFTKMAEYFEKNAYEWKEYAKRDKIAMDMGAISIQKGNKIIYFKKRYQLLMIASEICFTNAITYFEKLNNKEKTEELRKELELLKKE